MRVFSLQRGHGKTEMMAEWVTSGPDRVVVTMNEPERLRMIRKYNLKQTDVVTWGSAIRGALRGREVIIGIDNLDMILRQLLGDVRIATITKEF